MIGHTFNVRFLTTANITISIATTAAQVKMNSLKVFRDEVMGVLLFFTITDMTK
jgi:hypothetical protein